MSFDQARIAAALRGLADALESPGPVAETPAIAPTVAPVKRGRGRPVAGEAAPAAPVAAPAPEPDPFAAAPPPAAAVTLDQVRTALMSLKAAIGQDKAVALLKAVGGADNLGSLSSDKYAAVVAAATASATSPPPAEADPFAAPPQPEAKIYTAEDVRAAVVATGKRTAQDVVAKVVMGHGGKAPKDGGGEGPSLKALPPDKYAAVIDALAALPTTK